MVTQPLMYKKVAQHPVPARSMRKLIAKVLAGRSGPDD